MRILLCVAAALFVVSCQRETTTTTEQGTPDPTVTETTLTGTPQDLGNATVNQVIAPQEDIFVDKTRLGSTTGADNMVAEDKSEFARDEQVYLSMWFKESPAGLQASFIVEDADGKQVDAERKAMEGQKNVTFAIGDKNLKPGVYKVIGYWGGNVAAEYHMTVEDRRLGKREAKTP